MAEKDLWFALSMDDGVLGVYRTKAEAIEEQTPGKEAAVITTHKYGPGSYDVKWHYRGDVYDGGDFFLERGDNALYGPGGWEWAIKAWRSAGCPMGYLHEVLEHEGA